MKNTYNPVKFWMPIFLVLVSSITTHAQVDSTHQVKAKACAYQDSIVVRWAPNNALLWELGNQYGYHIHKYLILKKGKVLSEPRYLKLDSGLFKPKPLEVWEELALNKEGEIANYNAFIAAQSLYGEEFEITGPAGSPVQIAAESNKQDLRFSFALLAADYSAPVAKASGLRFVDYDVNPNEKYQYVVFCKYP